jgi:ABC-type multidrug transport system permease subunit
MSGGKSVPHLRWLVADSLVLARRNLEHVRQIPEKLLDVTLQPIMFLVLFTYVFGGVIHIQDGGYREYLFGGVLVQSLGFGIMGPATSIATDLGEGVVDRLRSLPMSRSAYLGGHVIAELASSSIAITGLSLTGLVLGWRIHTDLTHVVAGYALLLLFAFAMLWVGTLLGLMMRSPDSAQGAVMMIVVPLTFLASTFVPLDGLSPVLRSVASWNPVSALAAAVRGLFGNPTGTPLDAAWPILHPALAACAWCVVILMLAIPLAIRRFFQRTTG